MDKDNIIKGTENFIRDRVKYYDSGHDWWHIMRVRNLAGIINSHEKSEDSFIVDMGALLHDFADSKFNGTSEKDDFDILSDYLIANKLDYDSVLRLENIVRHVSFSSRNKTGKKEDALLDIIQDADRLDAIGAIGIARAFNYGGFRNNVIYSPDEGENSNSTIKHFDDKLLLLISLMNTSTARKIALNRHEFMLSFLKQFHSEWNMEDI